MLTPQDVDKNSVRVISQPIDAVQNLVFKYVGKTSAEIEAIVREHPGIQIVRDGAVAVESENCTGLASGEVNGQRRYTGLVLIFDTYDQAKLAEKALRGQ